MARDGRRSFRKDHRVRGVQSRHGVGVSPHVGCRELPSCFLDCVPIGVSCLGVNWACCRQQCQSSAQKSFHRFAAVAALFPDPNP
jgi:hypothetical protein